MAEYQPMNHVPEMRMADIILVEPKDLICLSEACKWLQQATDAAQVLSFRDRMEEVRHLMKQRGYNLDALNHAAELKLRAERRLGEILYDLRRKGSINGSRSDTVSLRELDLSKKQSSRWQSLATLPVGVFDSHVAGQKASGEELTTAGALRLARALKQPGKQDDAARPDVCSVDDLANLVSRGLKFQTIYGDPPWPYDNQSTRAATDNHYRTMTVEQLAALPIGTLAADNAQLHLWTTNGFLSEALALLSTWGFTYKSMLVWCKPQMGIGNYWRVSHELLLLGTKGRAPFRDRGLMSWLVEERGKHSSKPEKVRRLVERAGYGPRLELFGRHLADGWVVWGDQIERTMFEQASAQTPEDESEFEPTLFEPEEVEAS